MSEKIPNESISEQLDADFGSSQEVIDTIKDLLAEIESGEVESWENQSLENYLEAMQAWLTSNIRRNGDMLTWKIVKTMLLAGTAYE